MLPSAKPATASTRQFPHPPETIPYNTPHSSNQPRLVNLHTPSSLVPKTPLRRLLPRYVHSRTSPCLLLAQPHPFGMTITFSKARMRTPMRLCANAGVDWRAPGNRSRQFDRRGRTNGLWASRWTGRLFIGAGLSLMKQAMVGWIVSIG